MLARWFVLASLSSFAFAQLPASTAEVRLEGRVVDLRGEPVPAADVWVVGEGDGDKPLAQTKGDGDGCFVLAHVPSRDAWTLSATAAGFTCASTVVGGEDMPPIVLHAATTVSGVLRDRAGKPVAGAHVEAVARSRALPGTRDRAITGADGSFTLKKVPFGPFSLAAVVAGEGLAHAEFARPDANAIALAPGTDPVTTIEVIVHGLPVDVVPTAGLQIAVSGSSTCDLPLPWRCAPLHDDGRCTLTPVPNWDYALTPIAAGYVFEPRTSAANARGAPHRVWFKATARSVAMADWAGTLVDAADRPVVGQRLALRRHGSNGVVEVVTAANGAFHFACSEARGTEVRIEACTDAGAGALAVCMVSPVDRGQWSARCVCFVDVQQPLALRVVPAATVQGRLLDSDGRPVPFAEVELEREAPDCIPPWWTLTSTRTDREGRFQFALLQFPQRVRVAVHGRDGALVGAAFELGGAATTKLGALKLERASAVEGVVRDASGAPVVGARVRLSEWGTTDEQQRNGGFRDVLTDGRGRYRIAGVQAGSVWVRALADDEPDPLAQPDQLLELRPGETVAADLTMPKR